MRGHTQNTTLFSSTFRSPAFKLNATLGILAADSADPVRVRAHKQSQRATAPRTHTHFTGPTDLNLLPTSKQSICDSLNLGSLAVHVDSPLALLHRHMLGPSVFCIFCGKRTWMLHVLRRAGFTEKGRAEPKTRPCHPPALQVRSWWEPGHVACLSTHAPLCPGAHVARGTTPQPALHRTPPPSPPPRARPLVEAQ